jgi:hypothetical protein
MRLPHSFALFGGYEKVQRITNFNSLAGGEPCSLALLHKPYSSTQDLKKSIYEQAQLKRSLDMALVIIV